MRCPNCGNSELKYKNPHVICDDCQRKFPITKASDFGPFFTSQDERCTCGHRRGRHPWSGQCEECGCPHFVLEQSMPTISSGMSRYESLNKEVPSEPELPRSGVSANSPVGKTMLAGDTSNSPNWHNIELKINANTAVATPSLSETAAKRCLQAYWNLGDSKSEDIATFARIIREVYEG